MQWGSEVYMKDFKWMVAGLRHTDVTKLKYEGGQILKQACA